MSSFRRSRLPPSLLEPPDCLPNVIRIICCLPKPGSVPVSMVDASLRMSIVNLFKKLRDELGVSILYITYDLATAYYVSDRIAIMFH